MLSSPALFRPTCLLIAITFVFVACSKPASEGETDVTNQTTDEVQPWDQWSTENPSWVAPVVPYHIIDNIYFVGTEGLSSYLITSADGHILLDGALPQSADMIADNIKTLGFDISDVKILLNTHAHFDHSGGLARLKELSGGQLFASEGDRSALEGGFYLGAEDKIDYSAPPVSVDRTIADGETITLGDIVMTATITPGHTRGCTSWTMEASDGNATYSVLFFGGATVAGNRLIPPQYEGIVADYRKTFEITKNWRPDIFLPNHPFFANMEEKRQQLVAGDPLAFVDRETFPRMISEQGAAFEESLRVAESQ